MGDELAGGVWLKLREQCRDSTSFPAISTKYKDRYRARLKSVVQRKGQTVKAPDSVKQPSPVPDLMAALEQTLAEMSDGPEGNGRNKRARQEAR